MGKAICRDSKGRFYSAGNIFERIDGLIYCYDADKNFLFFTDDERVLEHNWGRIAHGYFFTSSHGKQIALHRFLMNPAPGELVDHINRNKADNRLSNLRITNKSVNAFNCGVRKSNRSGITGVRFRNDTKRWAAEIIVNYKKIHLGCYGTKEEAAAARKKAEQTYYGN